MDIKEVLQYICCPDCSSDLTIVGLTPNSGLVCTTCQLIFPIINACPIILDANSRNAAIEIDLIEKLSQSTYSRSVLQACDNTLKLLRHQKALPYAWEDEAHWSHEYQKFQMSSTGKNWNDRFWQRAPLMQVSINHLQAVGTKQTKVIVDLGCGEGQDFRQFLAPELGPNDLYIGVDLSLPGLILNRQHNPYQRSLYVVGSAERSPLRSKIADVLICFGTLHHTHAKENSLSAVARLSKRGIIVLSDPINGNFLPRCLRLSRSSRSAHDDSIDYQRLIQLIKFHNFEILYERQFSGLTYVLLMRLFRRWLLNNQKLHNVAHQIDDIICNCLGAKFDLFKPRGLLIALGLQ